LTDVVAVTASPTYLFGGQLAKERIIAMIDATIGFDRSEEDILTYEISDEALETAADTGKKRGNFTFFCSGSECPGGPAY
jgi:hypothetical protein